MHVFLASSLIYRRSDIFTDTKMSYTSIIDSALPSPLPPATIRFRGFVGVTQSHAFHPLFNLVDYLVKGKLWNKFVLVQFHLSYSASTNQFNIPSSLLLLPLFFGTTELFQVTWRSEPLLKIRKPISVSHFSLETTCATQFIVTFSYIKIFSRNALNLDVKDVFSRGAKWLPSV